MKIMEDFQLKYVIQKIEATDTGQTIPEIEVVQVAYAMHVIEVMVTQLQKVTQIMGLFRPRMPSRS